MENEKIYEALTGDLIDYSKFEEKQRSEVLWILKDSFKKPIRDYCTTLCDF